MSGPRIRALLCDGALSSVMETACNVGTPIERLSEHRTASFEVCDGHELARTTLGQRSVDLSAHAGTAPCVTVRFRLGSERTGSVSVEAQLHHHYAVSEELSDDQKLA